MCSSITPCSPGGPDRSCKSAHRSFSQNFRRPSLKLLSCLGITALILILFVPSSLLAQSSARNELSEYTSAVAHVQAADRVQQLQAFATSASPGRLKTDALVFIISEDLRAGKHQDSWLWASMLKVADPENAVAYAVQTERARFADPAHPMSNDQLLSMAKHGLDNLPHLRRPLGMNQDDFTFLSRRSEAMLKGAAGYAEYLRHNYPQARQYLRDAVAIDPNNLQNVYVLALADIDGKPTATSEGYLYLARAVDLSRGTPEGAQIAQFARNRYLQAGGNSTNWDQFLAAADTHNSPQPPSSQVARNTPRAAPAKPPQPSTTVAVTRPKVATPPAKATTTVAVNQPPPAITPSKPAPSVWADDTVATSPAPRRHGAPTAGGPVSLGILIETSLAGKENRSAVVNGLSDMLRHLGEEDEAFILTYDNNLVIEEDLTTDPHQLEDAMKEIRPQKGAVLDDAVAFAAGHLARIAKYPHRVLLVVSDGRNVDSNASPLQTSAEINAAGVKIYCIGMDVDGQDGRYRLQALSSGTGGYSDFVSTPQQFRNATIQIAQNMGIDFRF